MIYIIIIVIIVIKEAITLDTIIANKLITFIFEETGLPSIVCDEKGLIIAATVTSRIGQYHNGTQKMIKEKLNHIL